jgi:acetyltransferase-like isoleucine patch superfamily enzyme
MRAVFNRWRRRLWHALFHRIVFGESNHLGEPLPNTRIAPSTCIEGEQALRLADHVFIGQFNFIDATAGLQIGQGVQVTNFVSIVTHSSHRAIRLLGSGYAVHEGPKPGYISAPIEIGAYTFIGPHSLIEAGTRIGKGVVVCAYAQVRGEVPDFAIVAGAPARQIGDVREQDERLLSQHPELRPHYESWTRTI